MVHPMYRLRGEEVSKGILTGLVTKTDILLGILHPFPGSAISKAMSTTRLCMSTPLVFCRDTPGIAIVVVLLLTARDK
jgi:hypothetical protein